MPRAVPTLIGMNIFIFLLWQLPSLLLVHFMMENFLVSGNALLEGRPWVLLTSVFSHMALLHLFVNMYVLFGFGSALELALGSRSFLSFYLVAGAVASTVHALTSTWLLSAPGYPALGASGAICGVVMVFALMFPRERVYLFGLVPVPAIAGVAVFAALDLWGVAAQARGGGLPIGHGAHLGGAAAGIAYYILFLKRRLVIQNSYERRKRAA